MKPKPQKKPEIGPGDQNAEFEKSPDMIALDALAHVVLKAPKGEDKALERRNGLAPDGCGLQTTIHHP